MNIQLQNTLFKQFEPNQYYTRHFTLHTREDGRPFSVSRKSTILLNTLPAFDGNCILKKGKMLITCQVKARFSQQFINILQNKPSQDLLNIEVSTPQNKTKTNYEKKKEESYIAWEIKQHLKECNLQQQLLTKHKLKTYGYNLSITLKVLSSDGGLLQHSLLATQLALAATKLKTISIEQDGKFKELDQFKMLDLNRFVYPVVMCNVNGQIVVDPSEEEERVGRYWIVCWVDLVGEGMSDWVTKGGNEEVQEQVVRKVWDQREEERKNVRGQLDIRAIGKRVLADKNGAINLELGV